MNDKKDEYLDHIHGASANEASILIDAHEAIDQNQKLTPSDERLLAEQITNFRNHHVVFEYMDQFYSDQRWPAFESAIFDWFIKMNKALGIDKNYDINLYRMLKPYLDKNNNIDWLIENAIRVTSAKNHNYLIAIPAISRIDRTQSERIFREISDLFAPYMDRAAEEAAQVFGSTDRTIIAEHLWKTLAAKKSRGVLGTAAISDWALANKLYYFDVHKNDKSKPGFRMLNRLIVNCVNNFHDKAEWEKMFSMFDFEDFLEDTSLIIPYCKRVLGGRFYDIEEFLKDIDPMTYQEYIKNIPEF